MNIDDSVCSRCDSIMRIEKDLDPNGDVFLICPNGCGMINLTEEQEDK